MVDLSARLDTPRLGLAQPTLAARHLPSVGGAARLLGACLPLGLAIQCEYAACDALILLQVSVWQRSRLPWSRTLPATGQRNGDARIALRLVHRPTGEVVLDGVPPLPGLDEVAAVDPVRRPARRIAPCLAAVVSDRGAVALGRQGRPIRLRLGLYRLETSVATARGSTHARHEFRLFEDHAGRCRAVWR